MEDSNCQKCLCEASLQFNGSDLCDRDHSSISVKAEVRGQSSCGRVTQRGDKSTSCSSVTLTISSKLNFLFYSVRPEMGQRSLSSDIAPCWLLDREQGLTLFNIQSVS